MFTRPDQLPTPVQDLLKNPLINQIPTPMAFLDDQFRLCWANHSCEQLLAETTSRPADQWAGSSLFDLAPAARTAAAAWIRQASAGKVESLLGRFEVQAPGLDAGSTAWWEIRLTPVSGPAGGLEGVLALFQDVTPARNAAAAADENQHRLRAFFDNVLDPIILMDSQARILDANPAACHMLALPREGLLQHTLWEVVPAIDPADFQHQWASLLANGREEGIFASENIHGQYYKVEYRAVANILPGVHLVVLSDITTRVQAEEKLRETEDLLHNILDHAPMPIYAVTPDQRIWLANRAWSKWLGPFRQGMAAEDLRGKMSGHNLQSMLETNRQVLETGLPVETEEHMDHGEDSFTFYTVKFPLRDSQGSIKAVGGVSVDISDRIRIELGLRESEQKFRSLVEQSKDGIILTDEEGRVIEWNAAEEQITGIPAAQALGQYFWDIQYTLAPDGQNTEQNYHRLRDGALDMLRNGRSPWLEGLWETDLRRLDATVIRVQSSTFLVRTGRGVKVGSISRDVTRERAIQEEVNQRNRELTSLLGISQQISGELNLERMLQSVTDAMIQTIPRAEYAVVWLHDEERDRLVSRCCAGCMSGEMEGVVVETAGNVIAQVFHSDHPLLLTEIDPIQCGLPPVPPLNHMQALLGVALLLHGRPMGAVTVCSFTDAAAFSEQDSRWLQSLAGQMAVAIANARLFEQVSSAQERLKALSRRLVEVQEEERRKIARELHDEVGQILTGLKLLLRMTAQTGGRENAQNLKEAQDLTNDLLNRVHDMSLDLRPAMLDDLGLLPALLWQFDRLNHQTGIQVNFRHHGLEGQRFAAELETAVYRIAQEALTNVARHAGVTSVAVWVWANENELGLQVEDRGCGFNPGQALNSNLSIGLNGIRERAALLGGELTVNSTTGSGTLVRAVFPLLPKDG